LEELIQTTHMKHPFTKRFIDALLIRDAQRCIHTDDLSERQRFNLFRTLSLTTFLISLSITVQIISVAGASDWITEILIGLTCILAINYFALNYHKNYKSAYWISLLSDFLVLHFVTYYSGGIRNSGMMYMGGLILATFMLLGNKSGKLISLMSILNLAFFYFYSNTYGKDVRNIVDSDPQGLMLNLDYMITYTTATLLIYSLSNNLLSSKNIVITKVMESAVALEKKNEELKKLSLVASNTDNSVMITNASGEIEWVNDGFTRLTGFSSNEVEGKKPENILYGPLTSRETIKQLNEKLIGGMSFSGELQKYHKSGKTIWQQVNVTPILDDEGKLERFIHVNSDITERKEAEVKMAEYYRYLEKANKELDKFAYVVSHDLKAPLRAISNLTVWIEEDIGDKFTNDTKEHFKILKGRVMRMEALINGILDYSRADRVKSPNSQVDVAELIDDARELFVQDTNVKFNVSGKMPVLFAERMKLQQVIANLVSNAVKHNDKPNPVLNISCEDQGEDYLFCFEDNGPGIDPQFHEKIFVIFQTLQARDTFESTGVGLAIVKKIVDEAGGKIWVESKPGESTKFKFKWPKQSHEGFKPFQFTLQQNTYQKESQVKPLTSFTA
jgi:PAS domain S-box-containing protein